MMTRKNSYDNLNGIKKLWLDYMEHDYMHKKGHKISPCTSRNLKKVVE